MTARWRHWLTPLFGAVLFLAAIWLIQEELRNERFHDLMRELRAVGAVELGRAIALAALSYGVLTLYDALALHFIGRRLPFWRTALTSFIAYAFSHSLGFALLSGGGVRWRLYGSWGLGATEVALVTVFSAFTLVVGAATITGLAALAEPHVLGPLLRLPEAVLPPSGLLLLALTMLYAFGGRLIGRRISVRGVGFTLPRPRLALVQILIACADWVVAAAVLYVLLPSAATPAFFSFVAVFTLAVCAGLISHVPGGLGVFDGIVLLALPSEAATGVLAALVVFRGVYYLLPLGVAALLLGLYETLARIGADHRIGNQLGRGLHAVAPNVFAVLVFAAGALQLLSTALPIEIMRLRFLRDVLPIAVIEISHFLASLIGMAMLLVAWGLRRRLDAAWMATTFLLAAGAVAALLKAFRIEQAVLLITLLLLILPCRRAFYRKTKLTAEQLSLDWLAAVAMVVVGTIGTGLFVYNQVAYQDDLWWRFAFFADAPRFLRASAAAIAVLVLVGLWHLLRSGRPPATRPSPEDLARARAIVRRNTSLIANLALAGDKALLFGESGDSLLMYAIEGRSWVALGDPIGPVEERLELVWRFRELCDAFDGWPVFYQVPPESLPLYLELGLNFQKLGEQALVDLDRFSLDGGRMKELRQTRTRMQRDGLACRILDAQEGAARLDVLQDISNRWLAEKATREKGFSTGRFDPAYLAHFPIALVERSGRPVAFANLWTTGDKSELSVDLMRFDPAEGRGIMDFLFTELMLFGRERGYARFDLGMAPFSGLDSRPLAPLWTRAGAMLFRHGEHFYNFQGIRRYKAKFDPIWQPRYLASPGGLVLPRVMTNVATLIAGGLRGVVTR